MIGDNYHDIVGGKNAGVRTAGLLGLQKVKHFYKHSIRITCCNIFQIY